MARRRELSRRIGPSRGKLSRLEWATFGLGRERPEFSAEHGLWPGQKIAIAALAVLVIGGTLTAPGFTLDALLAGIAAPFLCIAVLRALALWRVSAGRRRTGRMRRVLPAGDAELPVYTVMVPLFREAEVVPGLIEALSRLTYPRGKLEVLILVEAEDQETRQALAAKTRPRFIRAVVVPQGQPRTKPRALNYALAEAKGDLIVVYDAEDVPEPDQLRRAANVMAGCGPEVGCLQASLNIYNSEETWLTRQFTIEYSALFDWQLPSYERFGLPLPLGGTSNHFRREALERCGGWDAFNVTEDADLGIRMARLGYRVCMLEATTLEEAPPTFGIWRRQRTRWLKGWMQTYIVHMRNPLRLLRELGIRGCLGLQVQTGALLLSALIHPWFYVLVAFDAWQGWLLLMPDDFARSALWWTGLTNLVAGYTLAMATGAAAVIRRRHYRLLWSVPAMPLYWLLVSASAYRALLQLMIQPFVWEKTPHRARGRVPRSPERTPVSASEAA